MGSVAGIMCFVFFWHLTSAQSYFYKENIVEPDWLFETGVGAGFLNCRTDLGGKYGNGLLAIDWKASRLCASVLGIGTFRQTIGFSIRYLIGSIGSADSLIEVGSPGSRFDRNLHFRSNIKEVTVLLEFYPFSQFTDHISTSKLQVLAMAGVGWYWFNPRAQINDYWTDLQPLHTEGQGFKSSGKTLQPSYQLNDLNIPVGLGLRWEAGTYMHVRLEALHRILFTDYLDDVSGQYPDPSLFVQFLPPAMASLAAIASDRRKSQLPFREGVIRGNPDKNDAFFHLQLSLTILLNRKKLH